jgi:hypothetical protein
MRTVFRIVSASGKKSPASIAPLAKIEQDASPTKVLLETPIRTFLAGLIVLLLGSAAQAQFGVPGGIAPYTINGPAAAAAGNSGIGGNCYWEAKGRSGGQYQCPVPSPPPPKAPAGAANK